MLEDLDMPESPAWWARRLLGRLESRQRRYELLATYYDGNHRLPEGDERCREAFRAFQRKARTNYCKLVADSVRERLQVVGFRTGGGQDAKTDDEAWAIWQRNQLDADSNLLHSAALVFSEAYVLVGPGDGDGPLITVEDPREVVIDPDPVNWRRRRAALKSWVDDLDGRRHAVLYLPDETHYFTGPAKLNLRTSTNETKPALVTAADMRRWEVDGDPERNPLGVVPVVRFVNNPVIGGSGSGEFEDVIDIQDRINDTTLNRLVITKLQAYRQRWAKGLVTDDDEAPFIPGVDLLWATEDPDVEFGEFQQVDLTPLLKAVEADVHAIVMLTGLPPHYVAGDLVNASADALAAAEARLVSKIRDRQQAYGESWEEVMRLAFAYLDDDRMGSDAEVAWADPERKSDAQIADAAVKKQTVGVPWDQLMEDLDYSPAQIERMRSARAGDALLADSLAAPVPAAAPPAVAQPAAPPASDPAVTGGAV